MTDLDDKLGYLLIKRGLLNNHQLTKALEFQAKLNEKNYMPIGEILIQLGFISRSNLIEALNEQNSIRNAEKHQIQAPSPGFKLSIIKPTLKNVQTNPTVQNVPIVDNDISRTGPKISNKIYSDRLKHKPIGEIMLEKGFINREQLSHALQYQSVLPPTHYKPIGEILLELKYITKEQLNSALGIQPPVNNNSLGEILKQLGLIDSSQLAIVLMQHHSIGGKNVPIGELLVQHGFITKSQLEQALAEQKKRDIY